MTSYIDGRWDGSLVQRNGVSKGVAIIVSGEAVVLHDLTHVNDVFQARAALCLFQIWHSFRIPSASINAWTSVHLFGAVVIQLCFASVGVGKAYPNVVLDNVFNELVWFVAVFATNFNKVKTKNN